MRTDTGARATDVKFAKALRRPRFQLAGEHKEGGWFRDRPVLRWAARKVQLRAHLEQTPDAMGPSRRPDNCLHIVQGFPSVQLHVFALYSRIGLGREVCQRHRDNARYKH